MDIQDRYTDATRKTAADLAVVARTLAVKDLSHLSLPQVEQVANLVAQVVPAGNVPGMILTGLARLAGRRQLAENARRDVNLLFKGVEQVLDQAAYGTLFAGPAAVLWGYQNLLRLVGQNPDDSFPQGTWQFYVEYALREDTARHSTETHGFDSLLKQHGIFLNPVDRTTAWAMACIHGLHQYDALLQNEWRERVYTTLLRELAEGLAEGRPEAAQVAPLYRKWEALRPYGRGQDAAANETYPDYRRRKFDEFLEPVLQSLPAELRQAWAEQVGRAKAQELPDYQRQMTILAYLDPEVYGETRTPYSLAQAQVGLIAGGRYALIPACTAGRQAPADVREVRAQVASLFAASASPATDLTALAGMRRSSWPKLRKKLSRELLAELDGLRFAPILINCDRRPRTLPLAELRQAERGIGGHAMTLFDTGETLVFDLSHIFFDGAWGAALAEILTNEALAWAVYLNSLPPVQAVGGRPHTLSLAFKPSDREAAAAAPRVTPEASAESETVNLQAILALRKLFKRRNDLLQLTVNDLLVLYRAMHALTYQPDPALATALQVLSQQAEGRAAARAALEAIAHSRETNPAVLIPIDASQQSPRQRLFPLNFEAPLGELDLLNLHAGCLQTLEAYKQSSSGRSELYEKFDRLQRQYLATLAGFGAVLAKAKQIAAEGEDTTMGVMKLFAPLPGPVQRLLQKIPDRFEMLNDLIRGREVFSNVGSVAPTSTLTRFITAKDDNEAKTLAWGVISDAAGVMRLSLRDFRPHVALLVGAGRADLAAWMARDYLEAYARGLNQYVQELRRITLTSRDTPAAAREHLDG